MYPIEAASKELAEINGQIADVFRTLSNGFQKLDKIKDANRQSRQLEELTDKMRDCKRLIKEFDQGVKDIESRNDPNTNRMLSEKKQSMLNSYVALKKQYASALENNKRADLFEGPGDAYGEDNVLLASSMTNQQLMDRGNQMMDETDEAIERSKKTLCRLNLTTHSGRNGQTVKVSFCIKLTDLKNYQEILMSRQWIRIMALYVMTLGTGFLVICHARVGIDEAAQDGPSRKKLVLNDNFPMCLMPKSGCADPMLHLKDDLYRPSQSRTLHLPPWSFSCSDDPSDCSSKGTMFPVVRINARVAKDHDSQPKVTHEKIPQGPWKSIESIDNPKDRLCSVSVSVSDLQLDLGHWYYNGDD